MPTYQQHDDGTWGPARPLPPTRTERLERWLRRHGHTRLARLVVRWDERGLGR